MQDAADMSSAHQPDVPSGCSYSIPAVKAVAMRSESVIEHSAPRAEIFSPHYQPVALLQKSPARLVSSGASHGNLALSECLRHAMGCKIALNCAFSPACCSWRGCSLVCWPFRLVPFV